jgi:hypothetical protein
MRPRLDEHLRERLARAIHDDYLSRVVADQDPDPDPERLVPYDALSEEVRESNRGQADDVAVKLAMVGAGIVPLDQVAMGKFELTPRQLDRLSRHEHARWMLEKRQAGWRFGPTLDPVAHTHPCLVGYDRLPDVEKARDRQAVERIPVLLRAVGLGIARLKTQRPSP